MDIALTSRSIWTVTWPGGHLDLNLVPMNLQAARDNGIGVGYASIRPGGILSNSIADLVGIVGMTLRGCPPVPRVCWDNREHQFWDGCEGAFEPRNVVVNSPSVELIDGNGAVKASYFYIAQAVKTTVAWMIRESDFVDAKPTWDTSITIENFSGNTLRNYLHFFASYHKPSVNYYWSADEAITPCTPGGFNSVSDSDQEARLRASPFHRHCDWYRGDQDLRYFRHYRPVLLSSCQPWYGGARHVVMVEPDRCAAMVTWVNQARDYMIRPPDHDLKPGEVFTTRVRHAITPVRDEADIETLWSGFMKDLATA